MLYSDIEELVKKASAISSDAPIDEEVEKVASEQDNIDSLVDEIDAELSKSLEKRASKVGIAKLLLALDILQ